MLKKYDKALFVFYFFVVACIYVSMMMLFGGTESDCNSVSPAVCCRVKAPSMWYWLIINVIFFYLICAFGLASWGQYLCTVADIKEKATKQALDAYMASGEYQPKSVLLQVGNSNPLAVEA